MGFWDYHPITGLIDGLARGIEEIVQLAIDTVVNIFTSLIEGVLQIIGFLVDGIIDLFRQLGEGIIEIVQQISTMNEGGVAFIGFLLGVAFVCFLVSIFKGVR